MKLQINKKEQVLCVCVCVCVFVCARLMDVRFSFESEAAAKA